MNCTKILAVSLLTALSALSQNLHAGSLLLGDNLLEGEYATPYRELRFSERGIDDLTTKTYTLRAAENGSKTYTGNDSLIVQRAAMVPFASLQRGIRPDPGGYERYVLVSQDTPDQGYKYHAVLALDREHGLATFYLLDFARLVEGYRDFTCGGQEEQKQRACLNEHLRSEYDATLIKDVDEVAEHVYTLKIGSREGLLRLYEEAERRPGIYRQKLRYHLEVIP